MALTYDNIIDADGHILEPADAWERYIDPAYRDRALRICKHDGREVLEMDGKPSRFFDVRTLSGLGGISSRPHGMLVSCLPVARHPCFQYFLRRQGDG